MQKETLRSLREHVLKLKNNEEKVPKEVLMTACGAAYRRLRQQIADEATDLVVVTLVQPFSFPVEEREERIRVMEPVVSRACKKAPYYLFHQYSVDAFVGMLMKEYLAMKGAMATLD